MARQNKPEKLKESVVSASEVALQLARDKKFRQTLLSTIEHSNEARRRVRHDLGLAGTARRLAADQELRAELRNARRDLQQAYTQLKARRRSHRLRKITLLAGLAAVTAVPRVRQRIAALFVEARTGDSLEDMTKEELYARAQAAEIPGRSEMNKEELIAALRDRA
ncbi:MAG TPA: Rho termination factor N-terminal domain-containing protein [Gaiellaceae bacterium]|jgi:Rho termination factor, N-terminal domain|nr:Rho termination factor N-terminal domain-containing protein [Gaiellaceae bacterium]